MARAKCLRRLLSATDSLRGLHAIDSFAVRIRSAVRAGSGPGRPGRLRPAADGPAAESRDPDGALFPVVARRHRHPTAGNLRRDGAEAPWSVPLENRRADGAAAGFRWQAGLAVRPGPGAG